MKYKQYHKEWSLGDLLLDLRRNIRESIRHEGLKYDLTFSQIEVLHFIGPKGMVTMRNIANYLKITPPSATEIVKEMEIKRLVERKNNKGDRRIVYVTLSSMSRKLYVSISKRKNSILKKMISKLSEKDRQNLKRIIKILITE